MAVFNFAGGVVTLSGTGGPPPTGGTTLPHVREIHLKVDVDALDITEMGTSSATTTKVNLAGLIDWGLDVTALQDFASSNVDAILWPLVQAASFYQQVKPTTAAISATNPQYYGLVILGSYNPLDGKVGEAIEVQASFKCAGAITRSAT